MVNIRHNNLLKNALVGVGKLINIVTKPPPGVVCLIYHSVADEGTIVSVPPNIFEDQVKWLADNYRIISLEEAISLETTDEDVVVLSFDDGYHDYLTAAYPIMEQYKIPSIVYVVTHLVQHPEDQYQIQAGIGKKSLNIDNIEALKKEPLVTIGSHTHTHSLLTKLTDDLLKKELEISYNYLREVLGVEDIHFSYPWASYNERTTEMVKRYYYTAVIGKGEKNILPLKKFNIFRVPVINEPLSYFKERVRGNFLLDGKLREHLLGRWRENMRMYGEMNEKF